MIDWNVFFKKKKRGGGLLKYHILYCIMIEYLNKLQVSTSSYHLLKVKQFSSVTDFFLENYSNPSIRALKIVYLNNQITQAARFDLLTEVKTVNINVLRK